MKPKQTIHAGFTLTELLVVIALIASLAILSILGMGTVRGKAQATQCMQNMRNLAMGILMYNHDNRGYYPPHLGSYPTTEGTSTLVWYGHIARYVSDWNASVHSPMAPVFYCPSNRVADPRSTATYISTADPMICRNYSYGYNYGKLSSLSGYVAIKSQSITNRAKLVILSEISDFQSTTDGTPFSVQGIAYNTNLKQYPGERKVSTRHGGHSNFAFADGHIETHRTETFINTGFQISNWLPESN